jgi:hypothetical protein
VKLRSHEIIKILTAALLFTAASPSVSYAGWLSSCLRKAFAKGISDPYADANADIFTSLDPDAISLRLPIEAGIRDRTDFSKQKAAWLKYFDLLGNGGTSFDPSLKYIKEFNLLSDEQKTEILSKIPEERTLSRELDDVIEKKREKNQPKVEVQKEAEDHLRRVKGKRLLDLFYNNVVRGDLIFDQALKSGKTPEEAFATYLSTVNRDFHAPYSAEDVFNILKIVQKEASRRDIIEGAPEFMIGGSFINGKADLNDSDLDMTGGHDNFYISEINEYFRKKLDPTNSKRAQVKGYSYRFIKIEYHKDIPVEFMRLLNPFSFRISDGKIIMSVSEPAMPVNYSLSTRLGLSNGKYTEYQLALPAEPISGRVIGEGPLGVAAYADETPLRIVKARNNRSERDALILKYTSAVTSHVELTRSIMERVLEAPDISDKVALNMIQHIKNSSTRNILELDKNSLRTSLENWMNDALFSLIKARFTSDSSLGHLLLQSLTSELPEDRGFGKKLLDQTDAFISNSKSVKAIREIMEIQKSMPEPRNLSAAARLWIRSDKTDPALKAKFLFSLLGPERRLYEDYFAMIPETQLPFVTKNMDEVGNLRVFEALVRKQGGDHVNNLLGSLYTLGDPDSFEYKTIVGFTNGLTIQAKPLTQLQWSLVMGENPAYLGNGSYLAQRSIRIGKKVVTMQPGAPMNFNQSNPNFQLFIKKMNSMDHHYSYRFATTEELKQIENAGLIDTASGYRLIRIPKH